MVKISYKEYKSFASNKKFYLFSYLFTSFYLEKENENNYYIVEKPTLLRFLAFPFFLVIGLFFFLFQWVKATVELIVELCGEYVLLYRAERHHAWSKELVEMYKEKAGE